MLPPEYLDELLCQRLGHRQALLTLVAHGPTRQVCSGSITAHKHHGGPGNTRGLGVSSLSHGTCHHPTESSALLTAHPDLLRSPSQYKPFIVGTPKR